MEVRLKNITKKFVNLIALQGISYEFVSKTFTCVYGPPGAGKSTLLRIISGLEFPDSGMVYFGERDVTFSPPVERNVSYVAQEFALYPHMNVFQNVSYPLRLKKFDRKHTEEVVLRVTRFLKIDHLLSRMPTQLSGGEQQRVAIARGLVKETDIYVFDEPLTNLDYKIREDMRGEFRKFQREFGQTIIYATGDPLEALSLAEKIIILDGGKIVEYGETQEVYLRPKTLFTMMNFGFPPANVLRGKVLEDGIFNCSSFFIKCPFDWRPYRGKEVVCAFRPENIMVVQDGFQGISFAGTIFLVDVIGSENVVYIKVNDGGEIVRLLAERSFRPALDERLQFGVNLENLFFYALEDGKFLGRGGSCDVADRTPRRDENI